MSDWFYSEEYDKLILFDILVNDQYLTTVDWKGGITSRFYDIEYPLPIIESNKNIKITTEEDLKIAESLMG